MYHWSYKGSLPRLLGKQDNYKCHFKEDGEKRCSLRFAYIPYPHQQWASMVRQPAAYTHSFVCFKRRWSDKRNQTHWFTFGLAEDWYVFESCQWQNFIFKYRRYQNWCFGLEIKVLENDRPWSLFRYRFWYAWRIY